MKRIVAPIARAEIWNQYWDRMSFEDNLKLCDGDQLAGVFHSSLDRGGIILEAGCGMAKWVATLTDEGYSIMGLDDHLPSLRRARVSRADIPLLQGSVTNIPLDSCSVDALLSLGVVEHFEEGPLPALREAYRVLKPGGMAIIETPLNNHLRTVITNYLLDLVTFVKRLITGKRYSFVEYRYSPAELRKWVAAAGFGIVAVVPKDYEQSDRSIGLSEIPVFRQANGDAFAINQIGQIAKRMMNRVSPWICSACVVCIAMKPDSGGACDGES